ncbi:unnamed protein product [Heterobilharzia americana]|nr:unnamed protein product [Heterobilharzia americana]
MLSMKLYFTVLAVMTFLNLLATCNPVRYEYDEPLLDFINMHPNPHSLNRDFWYKRMYEQSPAVKKLSMPGTVKRPQKPANYYYDLYRQSMLPTNEFLG